MRVYAQILVGLRGLSDDINPKDIYEGSQDLGGPDPAKRLRVTAFADEMLGPQEALKQLDAVADGASRPLTPTEERVRDALRRLYEDQVRGEYDHPSVSNEEAQFLKEQLGWFGNLALYPHLPEDVARPHDAAAREEYERARAPVVTEATRTAIVLLSIGIGMFLLFGIGLMGLPVFLLLWAVGVVRVGLPRGIPYAGVYAETFAIWLTLYVGLMLAGDLWLHDVPMVVRGCTSMPLSLVVVFWPVLRGVPWRQVRQDIGWTAGRRPLLEPLCGLVCYVNNLPLVVLGFITSLLLLAAYTAATQAGGSGGAGDGPMPTHPIVQAVGPTDWPHLVALFFLLSIVAPVVEETMFRGVLYRHLREVAFPGHSFLGGLFTATVVSLLFAAVHPQGLMFVPTLGALAMGFSLAREWRGTLVASMVAHGTHNFIVGMLGVYILSN
jgi:membrane protease YdiL (CAAX protease family)